MATIYTIDEDLAGLTAGIDAEWKRAFTRRFVVVTDASTGPAYVRANVIPPGGSAALAVGNSWSFGAESDAGARVLNIRPQCQGKCSARLDGGAAIDGLMWAVDVEYGVWTPQMNSDDGDPTSIPPDIAREPVTTEEVAKKDIWGWPILNTAGDPFDPPMMRERVGWLLRIAINKHLADVDLPTVDAFANTLNDATWYGYPARTVKCHPVKVAKPWSQFLDDFYYRLEWALEFNPDGWDAKILNCGYKELYDAGSGVYKQRKIILPNGDEPSSPAMLDLAGAYLPPPYHLDSDAIASTDTTVGDAALGTEPATGTTASPVVYLKFAVHFSADFTTLPLPTGLI